MCHVLRVRPDQTFELSDGKRVYLGRVASAQASEVAFELREELPAGPPLPEVSLLAAIFKFDRFEWMLEKVTELGATRVVPVVAERTSPALARAAATRVERWRRIGWEAAQQSRRLAPLEVSDPRPLERAAVDLEAGSRWILDESLAGSPSSPLEAGSGHRVLLLGPEGGFTEAERKWAAGAGFLPIGLGPLILRAETAAIAALAVLMCRRQ